VLEGGFFYWGWSLVVASPNFLANKSQIANPFALLSNDAKGVKYCLEKRPSGLFFEQHIMKIK
jgi:hypothetical protein